MSSFRSFGSVACKVAVLNGNKVWVRSFISPTTKNEMFDLPGGRMDEGEQPFATAIREVREELGFRIDDPTLYYAEAVDKTNSVKGNEFLGLFFVAKSYEKCGEPITGLDEAEGKNVLLTIPEAIEKISFPVCKRALENLNVTGKNT